MVLASREAGQLLQDLSFAFSPRVARVTLSTAVTSVAPCGVRAGGGLWGRECTLILPLSELVNSSHPFQ